MLETEQAYPKKPHQKKNPHTNLRQPITIITIKKNTRKGLSIKQ